MEHEQSKERLWHLLGKSSRASSRSLCSSGGCHVLSPSPSPTCSPCQQYDLGGPWGHASLWGNCVADGDTRLPCVPKNGVSPEKRSISCMHRRSPGQSSLSLSQLAAQRAGSQVTNAVLAASFAGLNATVVAQRPSHRIAYHLSGLKGREGSEAGRTQEL